MPWWLVHLLCVLLFLGSISPIMTRRASTGTLHCLSISIPGLHARAKTSICSFVGACTARLELDIVSYRLDPSLCAKTILVNRLPQALRICFWKESCQTRTCPCGKTIRVLSGISPREVCGVSQSQPSVPADDSRGWRQDKLFTP